MRPFIILILLTGLALNAVAQPTTYTRADSAEIVSLLQSGQPSTLHFAKKLLGRPYVAHTLEVNDDERLVVNTQQLDCTTLIETVTALTLCAMQDKRTFSDFTHALTQLRYRQGQIDGYPSRLHYFSDWINDKMQMGLVSEVQGKEKPFTAVQRLNINYMSQHPSSYKALKKRPELVKQIAAQERALTGQKCRYIPKSEVRNTDLLRSVIHDGDIIAITCKKPGLDIAHLGFAVWKNDGLHLLNASQLHKKVVIEPMTLGTYLSKHPSHTGIRIIRIQQESLNNN